MIISYNYQHKIPHVCNVKGCDKIAKLDSLQITQDARKNKIYCGDSFSLLEQIEDESIDLIICDGPYGVTQNNWDKISSIQEFNLNLIKKFAKKMKNGASLYLFGKPDYLDFIDYRPYLTLK